MNIRKIIILTVAVFIFNMTTVYAVRIKDLADIKGVRNNQLVGYGLIVGLDGTGDDDKTQFTYQSLTSMLNKMGIVVDAEEVDVDNVAAVMVTATLPSLSAGRHSARWTAAWGRLSGTSLPAILR